MKLYHFTTADKVLPIKERGLLPSLEPQMSPDHAVVWLTSQLGQTRLVGSPFILAGGRKLKTGDGRCGQVPQAHALSLRVKLAGQRHQQRNRRQCRRREVPTSGARHSYPLHGNPPQRPCNRHRLINRSRFLALSKFLVRSRPIGAINVVDARSAPSKSASVMVAPLRSAPPSWAFFSEAPVRSAPSWKQIRDRREIDPHRA